MHVLLLSVTNYEIHFIYISSMHTKLYIDLQCIDKNMQVSVLPDSNKLQFEICGPRSMCTLISIAINYTIANIICSQFIFTLDLHNCRLQVASKQTTKTYPRLQNTKRDKLYKATCGDEQDIPEKKLVQDKASKM